MSKEILDVAIATDADIFADTLDVPAFQPWCNTELAERLLSMSPEAFEAWAGLEVDDLEEYLEDTLFWARGGA